jgi:hypothetical protein
MTACTLCLVLQVQLVDEPHCQHAFLQVLLEVEEPDSTGVRLPDATRAALHYDLCIVIG